MTKTFADQTLSPNGTAVVVATVQHKPMRCPDCKANFSTRLDSIQPACPHCKGLNPVDDPSGAVSLVVTATAGATVVEHSWTLMPLDSAVNARDITALQTHLDQLRNTLANRAAAREAERLIVANLT